MPRRRITVDTTGTFVPLDELQPPLDWPTFFGNDHPVEVEVGPGKGVFLASAGSEQPGTNFVGVELAKKYALHSAARVVKAGLRNVRVVAGDAQKFLDEFVPDRSVEVLHVYFPDPWWKKRHRKRRVVNERFVSRAAQVVRLGGELRVMTDVEEYFREIVDVLGEHPAFEAIDESRVEAGDAWQLQTNFANKFRQEGRPFFGERYRVGQGGSPPEPPLREATLDGSAR
ncbi:tRNA (guanosine(46)-N7)-methyltransferase TrmB [Tautonia sociabilis]|uniref:tRNA (guanine-N(7)-)-methyltransferase n=1 Tax=Tautonia sociabilis TaxID=2080755 RepID=A0A432MI44_9BACT|nr:tRNA (guanosine(46)-N7)-methyltransferase TrmB [Tautonia sociabilis]RUL86873.1 tRNA (guanosine(46)-N7)-methyltransferase TrmB [Tautonia sociabilis]